MQEDCKYGENCYRPDCKYKHNLKTHKNIPCIHFQGRGCLKGDHCPYKHIIKNVQSIPANSLPSQEISNIQMKINPGVFTDANSSARRKISENLEIPEFFTQDITEILERHESEVDNTLKRTKYSPENKEEINNESRAEKIFNEAQNCFLPEMIAPVDSNALNIKSTQWLNENKNTDPGEKNSFAPMNVDNSASNPNNIGIAQPLLILEGKNEKIDGNPKSKIGVNFAKNLLINQILPEISLNPIKETVCQTLPNIFSERIDEKIEKIASPPKDILTLEEQSKKELIVELVEQPREVQIQIPLNDQTKEQLKEQSKEKSKEKSKEQPEVQPKEVLKEQPKEVLKEQPKEKSKEQSEEKPSEQQIERSKEILEEILEEQPKVKPKELLVEHLKEKLNKDIPTLVKGNDTNIELIPQQEVQLKKTPINETVIIRNPDNQKNFEVIIPNSSVKQVEKINPQQTAKIAQNKEKQIKTVPNEKIVNITQSKKSSIVEKSTRILTLEEIKAKKSMEAKKKEEKKEVPQVGQAISLKPAKSPVSNEDIVLENLSKSPVLNSLSVESKQKLPEEINPLPVESKQKLTEEINPLPPKINSIISLPAKRAQPEIITTQTTKKILKQTENKPPLNLLVTPSEWAPYRETLLALTFNNEHASVEEIAELKAIAIRLSTPEGLTEIVNELEQKLKDFGDFPEDPDFEKLPLHEKINQLYYESNYYD